MFKIIFINCKTSPIKINTIFYYGQKYQGRFVVQKYFSDFIGTVPTFGFRRSQTSGAKGSLKTDCRKNENFYESKHLLTDPCTRTMYEYVQYNTLKLIERLFSSKIDDIKLKSVDSALAN